MTTAKVTKTNYIDFPVTIGIRIKLTADQKQLVKQAYDEKLYSEVGSQSDRDSSRGGLRVETAFNAPQLTQAMGCDRYTLASLLGSNERFAVGQLQKWEEALGIKLIDRKEIDKAWKSYLDHVFNKAD